MVLVHLNDTIMKLLLTSMSRLQSCLEPSHFVAETGTKFYFLDIRQKANKNKHQKVISQGLFI
jgi:hypothetical protein